MSIFVELIFNKYVLSKWKENPNLSKREIGFRSDWKDGNPENDKPLSDTEVQRMKNFVRKHNTTAYYELFPEDK